MTNNITKKRTEFTEYVVFDSEDEIYNIFTNYGEAMEFYQNIITFYKDRHFYLMAKIMEPIVSTENEFQLKVKSDGSVLYD